MQAHLDSPLQPHNDQSRQSSVQLISSSLNTNHFCPILIQLIQWPQFSPVPRCTTTPTNLYSPSFVSSPQFVLIFNLKGKGICQFNFVIPFLFSSYLNLRRWMDRKLGRVLMTDHLAASTKVSHLSHLNLSRPDSFQGLEQLPMQQLRDTLGSGRIKLMSTSSSSLQDTTIESHFTIFADRTFCSSNPLAKKLLLKRGNFILLLALKLIIDTVHKPNVELMAILMPLPLKYQRLILNKFHQF